MIERDRIKQEKCDHIIAFHIGHCEIKISEIKNKDDLEKRLENTCCGGIKRLSFCPDCGLKLFDKFGNYIDWWKK